MDNDKKQRILFKDLPEKKVEADFEGGDMTSDAGVLFLRETEQRLGLIKRVVQALRDARHPSYIEHPLEEMIRQRVFQILCDI